MKILFLTHYFPPEGNAPASRTHEHTKRWVAAGHEVTVITSAPNVPHGRVYPGYRNALFQVEYLDGIRVIRVWTFLAANAGKIRRTLNYLSYCLTAPLAGLACARPDVLIATSPQFFCGWAGVILSWLRRLPFVVEIRDIWPDSIAAVGALNQSAALRLLTAMERQLYRSADQIVTVGPGYYDALTERDVSKDRLHVVPNGADLDRFDPAKVTPIPPAPNEPQERFICAYIGTIGMASGLDVVVEAATQLQANGDVSVQFWLVGDGADRERLQAKVKDRGLQNVHFKGLVKKAEIPHYLATADICLVHLRKDPLFETVLPSKLFEAMAMAKPVILGVRGSAAELLASAQAGIPIEPEDSRQLVETLNSLKENQEKRNNLGENGRRFVVKQYNRDHFANRYLEILEKHFDTKQAD